MTMQEKLKEWKEQNPLRKYRKENDLSQVAAAEKIGCSQQSIEVWESGRHYPKIYAMIKIEELIGGDVFKEWQEWFEQRPTIEM